MSLISEALRREQEAGGDPAAPQNPLRLAKPAEPEPTPEKPGGKGHGTGERVAGLLVFGGLLLLVGIGYLVYQFWWLPGADGPEPVVVEAPVTPPVAVDPAAVEPDPAVEPPLVAVDPEPVQDPAPVAVDPGEVVVVPVVPDRPAVVEPPPAVEWPQFRVQAAMGGGASGSVLIDGVIVPVGGRHGDLHILEITGRGVRIEFRGEVRTVPVRR